MNKELKAKIIKHRQEMQAAFPNLYDQRWVERAADQGWKDVVRNLEQNCPGFAEVAKNNKGFNIFATLYFTAFEDALNTFFKRCLDDTVTTCKLSLDRIDQITAELKMKGE